MNEEMKSIRIKLSNMKFRYDVFQMVNLYFSFIDMEFIEDDSEYDLFVGIDETSVQMKGLYGDKTYEIRDGYKPAEEIKKAVFNYFKDGTGKVFPWGTLVGIRPSKKALSLLSKGYTEEQVYEELKDTHETAKEKVKLCIDVAKYEESFVNKEQDSISVYVGMPFCPTRCVYCSFTSNPVAANRKIVDDYLACLSKEIQSISRYITEKNLRIETVYFGGGTPTAVNEEQFELVMSEIHKGFIEGRNVKEFTVECGRADSITREKLLSMKKYGVDRISINPQTMNDQTLKLIGRNHDSQQVRDCFKMARELGFDDINMDLIVGLPGENLESIKHSCESILALNPDNITIHGMSVKRGSRLHESLVLNQTTVKPNQAELLEMYGATKELSEKLNMKPYYMYRQKNMVGNMENVGYCRDEKICIYNIEMIEEKQTIIACGADAVSKVVFLDENRIERFANVKDVREYNKRIDEMIERKIDLLNSLYK